MTTEEKFLAAVDVIKNLPKNGTFQPSDDLTLKLYAYYMQATEGPCNVPKPSVWYIASRSKWHAWDDLGSMPKDIAMEKYVEELTKVIETMSYNENVSRFMSLIGPFYEFVPTEDGELVERRNPMEYPFPLKAEDVLIPKSAGSQFIKEEKEVKRSLVKKVGKNARASTNGHSTSPEQDLMNLLRHRVGCRQWPSLSYNDMLVLMIINLQTSMEDIVKKFDKLVDLAKTVQLKNENTVVEVEHKAWELNLAGTAFAVLWPVALHLYMGRH